jgi:pSer/pThr/pTyr-binding forkhead associated (FHA) protein
MKDPCRFMLTPTAPILAESWLELPDGRLFWLAGRCAIGRHLDNTLVLEAPSVSRHHALLNAESTGYTLSDLRSSNGTYVNRAPITRPTLLQDGDELRLGDAAIRYRCTRRAEADSFVTHPERTRRLEDVRESACWLLLADVAGYSALNTELGGKAALQRFQGWIAGMRPLIERHGGHINSYVGDAIFAWWPGETALPAQVRASLAAIETWRAQSPVAFRVVVHHGSVLFTRSERGEELSGQEVNFIFRTEKIAKSFGAAAMFSEAAAQSLQLAGHCTPLGAATVEGMPGRFVFFAPRPEIKF